jgi:hypothetical protein
MKTDDNNSISVIKQYRTRSVLEWVAPGKTALVASITWKLWFVTNIKMTFTLKAGVKSNCREIGFRGLV